MAKGHTRRKRKFRMTGLTGRSRKTRPKTFKTEDAAKKYAESKGIKDYKLVNLKSSSSKRKKIKVVSK
jgi:hypothetical protein